MSPLLKIFAIILVLLAAVLGFTAFSIANRPSPKPEPVTAPPLAQAPAASAQPVRTHPVVVAAKGLRAGAVIEPGSLEIRQWPVAPATGFADVEPVQGKVLRFDLAAGEPLTQAKIRRGLATYLNEGERAIVIPVNEISGAASQLEAGDQVDVFFMLKRGPEVEDSQARLLLADVRLLAYGARSLDAPAQQEDRQDAKAVPRTAILAIPTQRVNELLLAMENGKLLLAMRPPRDDARPDPALFPPRAAVLDGRPGLDAAQRTRLELPANVAYAGERLDEVAGGPPRPPRPAAAAAAGTRSLQVIRAGRLERVPY